MAILLAALISLALLVATIVFHHQALRATRRWAKQSGRRDVAVLGVIGGVTVFHLVAIGIYALVYYLLHWYGAMGGLDGHFTGGGLDYVYFSMTGYTTLGVGDIYPRGALRLVAGIEGLNGFVLLGWSASFVYLAMRESWGEQQD